MTFRKIGKIFFSLAGLLLLLLTVQHEHVLYGLGLAWNQFKIVNQSIQFEDFLAKYPQQPHYIEKIQWIDDLHQFALDSLKLKGKDSYRHIYDQEGSDLLYNISASSEFELKAYLWEFPIAGTFPYKGFTKLEEAKNEEKKLREKNYDTRIYSVNAWSSLGYFNDPILSNFLERSNDRLAELIFHELFHATVFIKNDISENENLASFVGQEATFYYYQSRFGTHSIEYQELKKKSKDYSVFLSNILNHSHRLDSLYQSEIFKKLSLYDKRETKKRFIKDIVKQMNRITYYSANRFQFSENPLPNNAFFMSFLRYYDKFDVYRRLWFENQLHSIKDFIDLYKKKYQDQNLGR